MAKVQKTNAVWGELGAATLGVALGGVLGMLFAPKPGKQTRKEISTKTKKTVGAANRTVKKAAGTVRARATSKK